jgi:drug/metabolite transporter (DMT)-like permease
MSSRSSQVEHPNNNSARIFTFLMVISMVIWGGSWVSAKVMAERLDPDVLSFWRFFLSFVSFVPMLLFLRKPFYVSWSGALCSLLGAIFISAYMYLFFRGLEHGLAGAAGVLVTSTMPLMTLLFTLMLFRKKASGRDIAGLVLGMSGAAVLLQLWRIDVQDIIQSGNLLFVLCSALWALVTICSQRAAVTISPYFFSFLTYGISTLFFLPSACRQGISVVFHEDTLFWVNLIFLAIISSNFATTIYFVAADRIGSYRTSSFVFLVPPSAMLLSWIFLGEVPQPSTIIGGTVAVAAVYLINYPPARKMNPL